MASSAEEQDMRRGFSSSRWWQILFGFLFFVIHPLGSTSTCSTYLTKACILPPSTGNVNLCYSPESIHGHPSTEQPSTTKVPVMVHKSLENNNHHNSSPGFLLAHPRPLLQLNCISLHAMTAPAVYFCNWFLWPSFRRSYSTDWAHDMCTLSDLIKNSL